MDQVSPHVLLRLNVTCQLYPHKLEKLERNGGFLERIEFCLQPGAEIPSESPAACRPCRGRAAPRSSEPGPEHESLHACAHVHTHIHRALPHMRAHTVPRASRPQVGYLCCCRDFGEASQVLGLRCGLLPAWGAGGKSTVRGGPATASARPARGLHTGLPGPSALMRPAKLSRGAGVREEGRAPNCVSPEGT